MLFGLFEPYHLTQYVMLFAAGILAYREGWMDAIPKAVAKLWSGVVILLVILLLFVSIVDNGYFILGRLLAMAFLGSFWVSFMCVSTSIALLSLFKNRFNSQSPITKALADNTFTVYLIHLPVIIVLQYLLIGI